MIEISCFLIETPVEMVILIRNMVTPKSMMIMATASTVSTLLIPVRFSDTSCLLLTFLTPSISVIYLTKDPCMDISLRYTVYDAEFSKGLSSPKVSISSGLNFSFLYSSHACSAEVNISSETSARILIFSPIAEIPSSLMPSSKNTVIPTLCSALLIMLLKLAITE